MLAHGSLTVTVHGPAELVQRRGRADLAGAHHRRAVRAGDGGRGAGRGRDRPAGAVPFDLEAGTVPGSGVTLWAARQPQPPLPARSRARHASRHPVDPRADGRPIPVPTAEPIPVPTAEPTPGRPLRRLRRSPPAAPDAAGAGPGAGRHAGAHRPAGGGAVPRHAPGRPAGWPSRLGWVGWALDVPPSAAAGGHGNPAGLGCATPSGGGRHGRGRGAAGPGTSATRRRRPARTCGAPRETRVRRVTQPRPPLGVLVTDDGVGLHPDRRLRPRARPGPGPGRAGRRRRAAGAAGRGAQHLAGPRAADAVGVDGAASATEARPTGPS